MDLIIEIKSSWSPTTVLQSNARASWLIPIKAHLFCYRAFLEYAGKLLSEVIHIVVEFHSRHDAFNLILNFLTPKLLEPLMMFDLDLAY